MLALFLASILLYSLIHSPHLSYPMRCLNTSPDCPSCGMSRGFSSMIRGNVSQAYIYNPYAPRLFWFTSIQLFIRITLIVLSVPPHKRGLNSRILLDSLGSTLLFMWAVWEMGRR
ncbi:MAG: DUF2752 domain-containing protein [Chitinophagales bacterium]|nr:DUF2752 domain-containing protein [Chitinophagales bacterium]